MNYPDSLLDEIRARVRVSEVVSAAGIKLIKQGGEFKALSPFNVEKTPSFTINDGKCFFHDFSSGKHGDVFGFLMETRGLSFTDAVKEVAAMGGVTLPGDEPKPNGSHRPRANGHDLGAAVTPRATAERKPAGKKVVATYPYLGGDGELRYEVVRFEPKTFAQRIPAPNHPGCWIWSLHKGDFVRRNKQGDWYAETDERTPDKGWGERITVAEDTPHGLFNFAEIIEEMRLPAGDRRVACLCEGEKDCQTLSDWNILATTNSGGAANWRPDHAAYFAGADVVVLTDNDKPGRERGEKVAKSLTEARAKVRVLDWKDWWKDAPEKADVTDWRDHAEGTAERLYEIIDRLKSWAPVKERRFKRLSLSEISTREIKTPDYVVEDWLVAREVSFIGGAPQSGKTFCATHLGLCIATGREVFGRKVAQGLVIYQTGESGSGLLDQRIPAWLQHYGEGIDPNTPFEVLPARVDLYNPERNDTAELIDCIRKIAAEYPGVPLRAVFIDTFAKAIRGGDETKGVDVGRVLENVEKIAIETGAHVCVIHHIPKGGMSLRGHTSLAGDVDSVVFVESDEDTRVRTISADKIKDGPSDWKLRFELLRRVIGQQLDGKEITSCVCIALGAKDEERKRAEAKGFVLNGDERKIFSALLAALKDKGDIAREEQVAAGVPSGTVCVRFEDWREAYIAARAPDDEGSLTPGAIRKFWERKSQSLMQYKVIGYSRPFIWRLPKAIRGFPETMDILRTETGQASADTEHVYGDLVF